MQKQGFPSSSDSKASKRPRFNPWVGKIPWRRKWQPTVVFLPGKFHGERSLAGYSLWGCKELDTTERLTHTHTHTNTGKNKTYIEIKNKAMNIHIPVIQLKS